MLLDLVPVELETRLVAEEHGTLLLEAAQLVAEELERHRLAGAFVADVLVGEKVDNWDPLAAPGRFDEDSLWAPRSFLS